MALLVSCPNCQARFDIADDLADQPVRCHQCMHVFERVGARSPSVGIQARPPSAVTMAQEDRIPEQARRRMPSPRPAFPWYALYLVVIGLLFFLLVVSVGFNVWIVFNADNRFRREEEVRDLQQQAQAQRMRAEAAAEMARQQQIQATQKSASLQRQNEELKRQVDILRGQLEDVRRDKAP